MPAGKGSPAAAALAAKNRKPEGKFTATGPIAGAVSPATPSPATMALPRFARGAVGAMASARGRQRGRAFGGSVPMAGTPLGAIGRTTRPATAKTPGAPFGAARGRKRGIPKPRRGAGNVRTPY